MDEIYRAIAHYLTYHGVYLHRWEVREALLSNHEAAERRERRGISRN